MNEFDYQKDHGNNIRLFISSNPIFKPAFFIINSTNKSIEYENNNIPIIEYRLAVLKFHEIKMYKGINIVKELKKIAKLYDCDLADTLLFGCVKTAEIKYSVRRDRVYSTEFFDFVLEDFNTGMTLISPLEWDAARQQNLRDLINENNLLKVTNQKLTTLNQDFAITIANLKEALENLREDNTTINQTLMQKSEEVRILTKRNMELSVKLKSMSDFISVLETKDKLMTQNFKKFYDGVSKLIASVRNTSLEVFSLWTTIKSSIEEETLPEIKNYLDKRVRELDDNIKNLENKFNEIDNNIKENKSEIEKLDRGELPTIDIPID